MAHRARRDVPGPILRAVDRPKALIDIRTGRPAMLATVAGPTPIASPAGLTSPTDHPVWSLPTPAGRVGVPGSSTDTPVGSP